MIWDGIPHLVSTVFHTGWYGTAVRTTSCSFCFLPSRCISAIYSLFCDHRQDLREESQCDNIYHHHTSFPPGKCLGKRCKNELKTIQHAHDTISRRHEKSTNYCYTYRHVDPLRTAPAIFGDKACMVDGNSGELLLLCESF